VWVTAALGIVCALSSWPLIATGAGLAICLIVLARPIEKRIENRHSRDATESDSPTD
jgi:putative Mg2+ transporter-C (MgtC) family protein